MTDYAAYATDTSIWDAVRLHHGTVLDGHVVTEWPLDAGAVTLAELVAAADAHDAACHAAVPHPPATRPCRITDPATGLGCLLAADHDGPHKCWIDWEDENTTEPAPGWHRP